MEGKIYIETVGTKPAWAASDERRIIYVADEDALYYATGTAWVEIATVDTPLQQSGDKLWYWQNVCPTGWTIDATAADSVIAVKGGSAAYNVTGGTIAATSTWTSPGHILTEAEIPSHRHSVNPYAGTGGAYSVNAAVLYIAGGSFTGYTGGGGSHNHGSTWRPKGAAGIICTKD